MKNFKSLVFASSSILAISSAMTAHAADPAAPQQQTAQATGGVEEIVVTARRKEENLEVVPETVDVVGAQDIAKYNMTQFTDISKLVPGLTLTFNGSFGSSAQMRGISYNEIQQVPFSVGTYLNDAPVDPNVAFATLYDIGDVEILKGPQGTLRGRISPSGAITVTTHVPDLEKIGGYFQATAGSLHDTNMQAAVNIPVVEGKFAIRIAAERDDNDAGGVHSVFNAARPDMLTNSARVSARLTPNDDINAVITYQRMYRHDVGFGGAEEGNGAPGGIVPGTPFPAPPAGYNGPVIGPSQYLTVAPYATVNTYQIDNLEGKVDWTIHGQKLSYVGSWYYTDNREFDNSDPTNTLPGYNFGQSISGYGKYYSQELRLASIEPLFGHLDYTVGFFYDHQSGFTNYLEAPAFQSGSFGSPLAQPILEPPNLAYAVNTTVLVPATEIEYAGFASATYHFDQKTEITAGLRYNSDYHSYGTSIAEAPFLVAEPLSLFRGAPCSLLGFTSTYPNTCNVAENIAPSNFLQTTTYHPVIYNIEASHRFNDDLMAYFRTGSAFRTPALQVGAASFASGPAFTQYTYPGPEKSKSYEVGLKSDWFDKRVVFNVDFYHQTFDGFFYNAPTTYFLKTGFGAPSVSQFGFTTNANAVVNGVEMNASARLTPHWTTSGGFAWDNGHLSGSAVPCNPPGGVPTVATFQTAGVSIFTCPSNAATSFAPRWNFNIESEYDQSINQSLDGFVRGLLYYYPSNPNANTTTGYVVPAYATLDLYLGLRNPDSQWEVSAYGKNITNTQTITSIGTPIIPGGSLGNFFGASGYNSVSHVARREFGLTLRYAFGSR